MSFFPLSPRRVAAPAAKSKCNKAALQHHTPKASTLSSLERLPVELLLKILSSLNTTITKDDATHLRDILPRMSIFSSPSKNSHNLTSSRKSKPTSTSSPRKRGFPLLPSCLQNSPPCNTTTPVQHYHTLITACRGNILVKSRRTTASWAVNQNS